MKRIALIILSVATIIAGSVSCQKENLQENSAFEGSASVGTARATIGGREVDVNWVQLWAGGPKFADYNVGATYGKAESYGGYYAWGGSQEKVDDHNTNNTGSGNLSRDDDTATKLWGSNWRMPTRAEFQGLIDNCDVEWTTVRDVNGHKFTGKGAYASYSVFLPAAGCYSGGVCDQGDDGYYWSSTPNGSNDAYYLDFCLERRGVSNSERGNGYSVRAVLAE